MDQHPKVRKPFAYSDDSKRQEQLNSWSHEVGECQPFSVVWITKGRIPPGEVEFPSDCSRRLALVLETTPLDLEYLESWRTWVHKAQVEDLRTLVFPTGINHLEAARQLESRCAPWIRPTAGHEDARIVKGTLVKCRQPAGGKELAPRTTRGKRPAPRTASGRRPTQQTTDASEPAPETPDPALLTMLLDDSGSLLMKVSKILRRFELARPWRRDQLDEYRAAVKEALKGETEPRLPRLSLPPGPPAMILPRVLVLGETGVGKSLFAAALGSKTENRSVVRIPVPEYIDKEDMFEYDVLGYTRGQYTGGLPDGSPGLLLENVWSVVFLDEIGDATPAMQAKLLGYMDSYEVRPRGWRHEPFYCPTLLVAATNRDLRPPDVFRRDLLARFTDVVTIPPLRERKELLPHILDLLLQSEAINPRGQIEIVGTGAFAALYQLDYAQGNLRELECTLREACNRAVRDGRTAIRSEDIAT